MNKFLFAASFLPLAASAAPPEPGAAVQQAFPAYSIDFRQAVLLAQVELKRAPADIATTAEGIKTTLGGDKDQGKTKAGKGGDGYTTGGYKEQGKTAGAGKDKAGEGYTEGGYKEQGKTAGAGKDKAGEGYTEGGYKDQAKAGKEASSTADDGYKTSGGFKDHKGAGAGKMAADGYKTTGGFKESGESKGLSGIADYMKSGRGAPPGLEERTTGDLKITRTEGASKWGPAGGIKGEESAAAGKALPDGTTTGGIKLESMQKSSVIESPLGGKSPVAPAMPVETMKIAPLSVPLAPSAGAPPVAPVAPAVLAPQPVLIKSPTLVPSVLPTK